MKRHRLIALVFILSGVAFAQNQGAGTPCLFQFERGVVADCIRKTAGGLIISARYLNELEFDKYGLAPVRSESAPYGWMYVNRSGTVVVSGVPTFDNWADEFHDGLVRFVENGKYGFANRQGKIVIPASYDWASPFEKGVASICNGCHLQQCTGDCEHRAMEGGQWAAIDTHGKVIPKRRSVKRSPYTHNALDRHQP